MAAGNATWFDNDGKSIDVDLLYTVNKDDVVYADGWFGIANNDGVSGQKISITIDDRAYQFTVPTALAVAKGDIVYITIASIGSGHVPADAAYSTTAGAGKVALFKAMEAKDSNHCVIGKLLPYYAS